MGSFNETCALSNLNIAPGTPVRLLFLTQNPYVVCDQHETHRGCYHHDQWFVRTPPIKGVYDDYGTCDFKESPITDLICDCFQDDIIERPFGFNQYHTCDVTKTKGIHHFLQAAWQGRLLVRDGDRNEKEVPDTFPTWQKIHAIFKKHKLPIQLECDKGYNAQPVSPGVVCVTFNSYDNNTDKLKKAKSILKQYDCKLIDRFKDRKGYDTCLIVAPSGAFDDPSQLFNDPDVFKYPHDRGRLFLPLLPVLAVMIREDIWQIYCNMTNSVNHIFESLKKACEESNTGDETLELRFTFDSGLGFREFLIDLPFQTGLVKHIITAFNKKDFTAKDELLLSCAEMSCIEDVMERIHQPWYIPPLGGQDGAWKLRTKLLFEVANVSKKEMEKENER